jgi:hypothetical protein
MVRDLGLRNAETLDELAALVRALEPREAFRRLTTTGRSRLTFFGTAEENRP